MGKRHELTLGEKMRLIGDHAGGKGLTQRRLASKYSTSLGAVSNIVKKRDLIARMWEENISPGRMRSAGFDGVNLAVLRWFEMAGSRNMCVTGWQLQSKAREMAARLGLSDFKGSNGWLQKFKSRFGIVFRRIGGELGSVDMETVDNWKSRLPDVLASYEPRNIFNCDETALFFRALPDRLLVRRGGSCKGGKQSKERFTVLLCAGSTGEKLRPLVIWRSRRPRAFGRMALGDLRVRWEANRTAWMTREIFRGWLEWLNGRMAGEERKIALLLDNAGPHPRLDRSHVRLVFIPANTSAACQPLDQGVISVFKGHYRKNLMLDIMSSIDSAERGRDAEAFGVARQTNILRCIEWIVEAWDSVTEACVRGCFARSGIQFPEGAIGEGAIGEGAIGEGVTMEEAEAGQGWPVNWMQWESASGLRSCQCMR
jgi:hypothetical protein